MPKSKKSSTSEAQKRKPPSAMPFMQNNDPLTNKKNKEAFCTRDYKEGCKTFSQDKEISKGTKKEMVSMSGLT
jgi:hypothetical protein